MLTKRRGSREGDDYSPYLLVSLTRLISATCPVVSSVLLVVAFCLISDKVTEGIALTA